MIIFLVVYIVFSFVATVLKFSMIEKKRYLLIAVGLLFVFSIGTYQLAIHQNNQTFLEVMQNRQIVSFASLLQIIESILMVLLAFSLIGGHFKKRTKVLANIFSILPSIVLLGGLFLLQVYAFLFIENISFEWIAILFSITIILLTLLSVLVVKWVLPSWEIRAELKILVAFLQILLAMFLPIIVNEIKVPYSNLTVDIPSILVLSSTVLFFVLVGLITYKYKIRLKLW